MKFTTEDTVWTASELGQLPSNLLVGIALYAYKKGEKTRALALIQQGSKHAQGKPNAYAEIEAGKFREECVKANDVDTVQRLAEVAPEWFGPKKAAQMGGLCLAVVSKNKDMFNLLVQSGAKPDAMSTYEAGRVDADLVEKITKSSRSQKSYEGVSAFYWACASGDLNAAKTLLEKFPEEAKLSRDKQEERKGPRGGHHGYARVIYEDVWGSVVAMGHATVAQWLFDRPEFKEQVLQNLEPNANHWSGRVIAQADLFASLPLLTKEQEKEVWEHFEQASRTYASQPSIAETKWKNASSRFSAELMKARPKKYVEYLEKYDHSVDHSEWRHALRHGDLDVVKALARARPEWLEQTWEDHPAETRRTKREKGPFAEAFFNSKNEDVIEWLSKQPGVFEREAPRIQEYLERGWGHDGHGNPHRPSATPTDLFEWGRERKRTLAYTWQRLQLKKRVESKTTDPQPQSPAVKAL